MPSMMGKFSWVLALLLASVGPVTPVNETIYSGFLVDVYCFGLVKAGGLALDGTNVITDPGAHTIHCLRDPSQCISAYYLAINVANGSSTPNYQMRFTLDDTGNANALALLRQTPVGSPEDHIRGEYTVTATGVHSGDNVLRDARFVRCSGPNCDGVCEGNCGGGYITDIQLPVDPLLRAHVFLMIFSWCLLLPIGVLWARHLRDASKMVGKHPIWFAGHRIIQSLGWLLQLCGFACILVLRFRQGKLAKHFASAHEQLGLTVTIIGTLQPINAMFRHLKCVGHPQGSQPSMDMHNRKTTGRKIWEVIHKGFGYTGVILGAVNCCVGIAYANDFLYEDSLIVISAAFTGVFLGILLIAAICLEIRRWRRPRKEESSMPHKANSMSQLQQPLEPMPAPYGYPQRDMDMPLPHTSSNNTLRTRDLYANSALRSGGSGASLNAVASMQSMPYPSAAARTESSKMMWPGTTPNSTPITCPMY